MAKFVIYETLSTTRAYVVDACSETDAFQTFKALKDNGNEVDVHSITQDVLHKESNMIMRYEEPKPDYFRQFKEATGRH